MTRRYLTPDERAHTVGESPLQTISRLQRHAAAADEIIAEARDALEAIYNAHFTGEGAHEAIAKVMTATRMIDLNHQEQA